MGRLEHLNRLGLGLSAFQRLQPQERQTGDESDDTTSADAQSQQYDSNGRPKSSRADKHNAEQRFAQNEVLELANVVERKQHPGPRRRHTKRPVRSHEYQSHARWDIIADGVSLVLTWYPRTLLQRSLLGVYRPGRPVSQIFLEDLARIRSGSLVDGINVVLPGLGLYIADAALLALICSAANRLKVSTASYFAAKPKTHLLRRIMIIGDGLHAAIELYLQPILHFGMSTRLGLVKPHSIVSATAMLVGFYDLYTASLLHHKWTACTVALSLLIDSSQDITAVLLRDAFVPRRSHRRPRRTISAESSIVGSISQAFRHVKWNVLRHLPLPSCRCADQHDVDLETTACESCHSSQGAQDASPTSLAGIMVTGLTRLMRLPLDIITLHCSARSFNDIVGPVDDSGGRMQLPIHHPFGVDKTLLELASKVGLTLGLTLAIEATWYTACTALRRSLRLAHDRRSFRRPR